MSGNHTQYVAICPKQQIPENFQKIFGKISGKLKGDSWDSLLWVIGDRYPLPDKLHKSNGAFRKWHSIPVNPNTSELDISNF